jgi:menaquinone-9 beta-reductase
MLDVAVVGGGPAGLAAAIACAERGATVCVFERGEAPLDKACGEGLLPPAVSALERLGVLPFLATADCARFHGLRYVQEDGSKAEARLPAPGLGVRRLALSLALDRRAEALGVERRWHCGVHAMRREASRAILELEPPRGGSGREVPEEVEAQLVVAADGLASPLRHAAGLDRPPPSSASRRFGMRRHFRLSGQGGFVEVHLSPGVEAYLTPVGPERVGLAFLWADGAFGEKASFPALLSRFPALQSRFEGAEPDSDVRGAGPFLRGARRRVADRLVLIGDAAGYVDAITGEGLSLAFVGALALGDLWPEASQQGLTARSLRRYERAYAARFNHYARVTEAMLALARRPSLRRRVVRFLGKHPRLFDRLVAWGLPAPPAIAAPLNAHRVPQS